MEAVVGFVFLLMVVAIPAAIYRLAIRWVDGHFDWSVRWHHASCGSVSDERKECCPRCGERNALQPVVARGVGLWGWEIKPEPQLHSIPRERPNTKQNWVG